MKPNDKSMQNTFPKTPPFDRWMTDLGDVLSLAERSSVQSQYPLAILRTRIFPSLWHGQYIVHRENGKAVAFVNWAWLEDSLSARYQHTQCYVAPDAWRGGRCLWFMEILGPAYLHSLIQQLRQVIPPGTLARWHEVHAVGGKTASLRSARFGPDAPV